MNNKQIEYKDKLLTVRAGAWLDVMNSGLYEVIDTLEHFQICKDIDGVLFALPYWRI